MDKENESNVSIIPTIDERLLKAFEKIAEKTYLTISQRDFRATTVHREEKGEIPSDVAAFMHIDEEKIRDQLDNPVELDVKGTIDTFESYHFKDVNYAMALAKLKNWAFFEEKTVDKNGKVTIDKIPINLAQIDMLSKKRLNLSLNSNQSNKHIQALKANAGIINDDAMQKASRFFGWRKESKQRVQEQYNQVRK